MYKPTGIITLRAVKLNLNIVDNLLDLYLVELLIPMSEAYVLSRAESDDDSIEFYRLNPLYKGIVLMVANDFYLCRGITTPFLRYETTISLDGLLRSLREELLAWKQETLLNI